jgi:methionyl-tRNA formyltransferase
MNVGFLVSGSLGETVLNYFIDKFNIQFVFTDKKSKSIIELSNKYNIPIYAGNPRDNVVNDFIEEFECDIIVSVNYLFIIDKKIIDIARGLCFNIHGSLLPKYRGRTPHVWSIINGEVQTGITAHVIDEGCDTGPIITQVAVDINKEDTGATILDRYKLLYIPMIYDVFEKFKSSKIEFTVQDESKASFYGKRTPEDGLIDWSWHRERIYNWVRAQSSPYPGAFTFYLNGKVIIDWIELDDYEFDHSLPNGTIVTNSPIRVKTPNGLVRITELRNPIHNIIVKNKFEDI